LAAVSGLLFFFGFRTTGFAMLLLNLMLTCG
jgi:hypothetical protein